MLITSIYHSNLLLICTYFHAAYCLTTTNITALYCLTTTNITANHSCIRMFLDFSNSFHLSQNFLPSQFSPLPPEPNFANSLSKDRLDDTRRLQKIEQSSPSPVMQLADLSAHRTMQRLLLAQDLTSDRL